MTTLADWKAQQQRLRAWERADDRAPVRLRVLETGRLMELRNDVPRNREECPEQRPCGHVRCRWHLWRVDSTDRAGRPHHGQRAPTTLRAGWLETPTPPSCALDYIERGEMSSSQIAEALGMDRGNVWLIWQRPRVRRAFERLREILGVSE
jgi:hypothetical protein